MNTKKLLLPIIVLAVVYLATRIVFAYNWHVTPYRNQTVSQAEQMDRNRVFRLLFDGETAWREGRLKDAENYFKACINDKASFDKKMDFDKKARANLAKLYEQERRTTASQESQ